MPVPTLMTSVRQAPLQRIAVACSLAVALSTGACLQHGAASASSAPGSSGPSASSTVASPTPAPGRHRGGATPGRSSKKVKITVDPRLFGVHDANLNSLHRAGTGSIRLWDSYTTWADLFSSPTSPDWSRLDTVVSQAHANHTEVTLVLGLTPKFAAANPGSPTYATSAPDLGLYRAYVRALMKRYRHFHGYRAIAAYQVWNEANITTFWSGTYAQLGRMTKTVDDVRDAVDPGARVIAPAMVTRLPYQQEGVRKFYATKVGGVPVWKFVDAISLNLYPLDRYGRRAGTPEDSMSLLRQVRAVLARDHVPASIPIWNTEVNYGMHTGALGGHSAAQIAAPLQVAYLMRNYLLNAARGVKRVDWYAYDMGNLPADVGGLPLGNTLLTDPNDRSSGVLTPAGRAFTRVQQWMRGSLIGTKRRPPCSADKHGTYTCVVKYAHGYGRIYWNPYHRASVRLVASARQQVAQDGSVSRARPGRLKVGYQPVLVRSKK